MAYIDAFVLPVKKAREDDYKKWAELGCKVWMELGALAYSEHRAEDAPVGTLTSFPRSVQLEEDEIVYVSYITYRDKAQRDEINAKAMEDPRLADMMKDSPADMKRMIFGGFETVVSSQSY